MEGTVDFEAVRSAALAELDRAERRVKWFIVGAALLEGVLLTVFLVLMDFSDRLHWLVLIAALLTYATLGVGLMTLGAYVNMSTQRVLKALATAPVVREPDRDR